MAGTQELTRRIKSIKSTRKVTRAMQMVSASKMRKAQQAALASRTYSELVGELMHSLSNPSIPIGIGTPSLGGEGESHFSPPAKEEYSALAEGGGFPLLRAYPKAKKIAVVIVSANKGLVGSFNTNLLFKLRELERENPDTTIELITIGRKVSEGAARLKKNIVADFAKSDGGESVESVYPVAGQIAKMYQSGQYKTVYVLYNHFVSTLTQKAVVKQLLPFAPPVIPVSTGQSLGVGRPESSIKNKGMDSGQPSQSVVASGMTSPYTFEPSPTEVINQLIPRIIESQLYQALLESDASEHSSRMIMMKNATDSAGDLITDLTLTFNQLRQNKITTELSEITAGKLALESN